MKEFLKKRIKLVHSILIAMIIAGIVMFVGIYASNNIASFSQIKSLYETVVESPLIIGTKEYSK